MTRLVIDARVRDMMSRNLIVMPLASSAADFAKKMTRQKVGSILAVDHEGKPVGIVTERDIVRQACSQNLSLQSIPAVLLMSSPLVSAQASDTLEKAVELMIKYGTRHLLEASPGKMSSKTGISAGRISRLQELTRRILL